MGDRLSQWDIAIVKHTYTPTGGAEQELLQYLLPKTKSVTYVSHPFASARGVPLNSRITFFEDGQVKDEFLAPLVKGPFPVLALKDVIYTLWYLKKRKFQLYFGVDNLNAFSGVALKRLGIAERTIYYVIDYAPERFRLRSMQGLYRLLDRWCCYHCDAVWNVSASMEQARRLHGADPQRCAPQIEVPLGNRFHEITKQATGTQENLLVFLGSLTKEQGLDLVIEALPAIKKKVPAARLRVVGDGPEMGFLKNLAKEKNVADSVEFLGFIEDDSKAAALVAEGAVAVAPYLSDRTTYKRYADPGKVKIYLAAGLPVVISRVPPVARLIENEGVGIAIEPSTENLTEAVLDILLSRERRQSMREKALRLGESFDWNGIFDRAFARTLECWRI